MNKIYLIALAASLSACATHGPSRSEAEKNYLTVEQDNQETSRARAEHTSRASAIGSRIRAIDSQIANQRSVITHWKNMPEVPSSPAMIANARQRLKQLNAEKAELMGDQAKELEQAEGL